MRRATVIGSSSPSPAPCRRRKLAATAKTRHRPAAESSPATMPAGLGPVNRGAGSPLAGPPRSPARGYLAVVGEVARRLAFAPSKLSAQDEPGIWLQYGARCRGRRGGLDLPRFFGAERRILALQKQREKIDPFQLTAFGAGAYIPAIGVAVRSRRDDAPHQAPHWYSEKSIRQLSGARSCDRLTACRRVGASRSRAV
jgi:hypothetical protein